MEDSKTTLQDWCLKLRDVPVIGGLVEKRPKVAVLRLSGVIAETARTRSNISYDKYVKHIDRAFTKSTEAVALVINSPGGSAAQAAVITRYIRRKAEETGLPVYAFVEDVAASGGYWLACAADEIYAQRVSVIGSVGVISASFGFQDLIAQYGVERRIHTSGKDKSFLDPFEPEREQDVKRLKDIQKDIHEAFIAWIKERRGEKLEGTDKEIFEGQFWAGERALDYGFIDGLDDVYSFMTEKYGERVKLIAMGPEKKILPSLLPFTRLADDVADSIESRLLWSRFGL